MKVGSRKSKAAKNNRNEFPFSVLFSFVSTFSSCKLTGGITDKLDGALRIGGKESSMLHVNESGF